MEEQIYLQLEKVNEREEVEGKRLVMYQQVLTVYFCTVSEVQFKSSTRKKDNPENRDVFSVKVK